LAAAGMMFGAHGAWAGVHRRIDANRPSIIEIGDPTSVDTPRIEREAQHITQLREFLDAYGYPDYAELQEVAPEWPFAPYEIRTYYLDRNLELDFGHVFVSPAMPDYGTSKYQGEIAPEKRHQIEVILASREAPEPPPPPPAPAVAPPPPPPAPEAEAAPQTPGLSEALVARIEAAAERAAQAADRAAADSEAAERAADRTTSIIEKMQNEASQ